MITYTELQSDLRKFLALTGLTHREFQLLLPAFARAHERLYLPDQTLEGKPRQRFAGGGRKPVLQAPEQKLLFLLVYLKTYPLQTLLGELFELSQPRVNQWIHRLLPILQDTLDELGVLPERDPGHYARSQAASGEPPRLIIDGTERRRQRPKNPEKQAAHYSGKKKMHSDKNVVIANLPSNRIGFLSGTYAGKTHDKKVADQESISYPPGTVLFKDTGFQGYEPAVKETCQAKKKAARRESYSRGEANEPEIGAHSSQSGARASRGEALPNRERCLSEHKRRGFGCRHGSGLWVTQSPREEPEAASEKVTKYYSE
jgi:Helix-turn-helix of DDE superfamily endonuclease/DDE superfamily endonuclease